MLAHLYKQTRKPIAKTGLALLLGGISSVPALADWGALNMTEGVTPISQQVYDLHMTIFYICVAIGIVVFGAMFYSIYKH